MKPAILATVLALALAAPAAAQPLPDPEGALVAELVVQAAEPGPAWWRVEDEDTTVYILGVADDRLPAGLSWDRRAFERRMTGANSFIVGTRVGLTAKIRDIPALLKVRDRLRSKTPMEETLSPPLRARFVAARERIGQPAKKYAGWTPLIAGEQLVSDVEAKEGAGGSFTAMAVKEAKRRKVKVVDPVRYDGIPFMRQALDSVTPAIQQQCMEGALKDAEAPSGLRRAAAEGWAKGDVAAALREPRSFDRCILLLGGGTELWNRARDDRTAAIADALKTPGHAVAIVNLRQLLAEDGIIVALRRRGLEVQGPNQPE